MKISSEYRPFSFRKSIRKIVAFVLAAALCAGSLAPATFAAVQDPVTGAFEGTVTNSQTRAPIAGAVVQMINQTTEVPVARRTGSDGKFYQGLLQPGIYRIRVAAPNYQTMEFSRRLIATRGTTVVPLPIELVPVAAPVAPPTPPTTTPDPNTPTLPKPPPTPTPTPAIVTQGTPGNEEAAAQLSATDGRRGGVYTEEEVAALPLGAESLTRTFDNFALLIPGLALPPQTQGSIAGPGVGAGVGSAGQFSANGLRSRANNFLVDGSDNNDEDIGVRRQGFFALVPQPVESIKEYQVISLLAPAQFGRNFGAQVNAVSKSGSAQLHGTLFGFLNTSDVNARDFFDTRNGTARTALSSGNLSVLNCSGIPINFNNLFGATGTYPAFFNNCVNRNQAITTQNFSGGKDSSTLGQFGVAFGGPLPRFGEGDPVTLKNTFYFVSAEGQILNAVKEASFAVPTVAQRGLFDSGATAIFRTPLRGLNGQSIGTNDFYFPTTADGDAIFSLFPFPNNPRGAYGPNTFTQTLPASAEGYIASGKIDHNFKVAERQQGFTARYNFTQDSRFIPVTGGGIFSTLRPDVRTQNISTFLNSELSGPNAVVPVFNQVRISYGRTRLAFADKIVRDGELQLASQRFPNIPFLLNAPLLENVTLPDAFGVANTGPVLYRRAGNATTEGSLGPVGQVNISGFSPIGVDVFNFPQTRANNTYQVADTLSLRVGGHSLAFGTDIRRTELNSDLPRNARPLITFGGGPQLDFDVVNGQPANLRFSPRPFIRGVDLAASGASSGFLQTFATGPSDIRLRYYQTNFFAQDEWRVRPNLALSYGLRYEYNTRPREGQQRIERTFNSSDLNLVPGLRRFIDARSNIFETQRNNVAPRVGFAYSPEIFGPNRTTVLRAGYGVFYDQILGAVVSQSRNVFPTFLTANFAGGGFGRQFGRLTVLNPLDAFDSPPTFLQPGQLNRIISGLSTERLVQFINFLVTGNINPAESVLGATLPARRLQTPLAHQYSFTLEQQLSADLILSLAYVGTMGEHLLRFTTPNLGPNEFTLPLAINTASFQPQLFGFSLPPGALSPAGGRPFRDVGVVNIFETTADSRYDALQVGLRGRLLNAVQLQVAYTLSKALDDVSDVFDLAGAGALPQNSDPRRFGFERGRANFDTRHRFAYNFVYTLPTLASSHPLKRGVLGGYEFAGTGQFQSGQPFTVNSTFDVNLDGNLTDRLNTARGITQTDSRRQPLRATVPLSTLLAAPGQDGAVGRNTFQSSNFLLLNLALIKNIVFTEHHRVVFRFEAFNFLNRANFAIPVRFAEAPGFGEAVDTVTPNRRLQFGLKYSF